MFDSVHTGLQCGQVKCLGRAGRHYVPGDRVRLEVAAAHDPSESSTPGSLPEVDLADFQVIMEKGLYLLVRHSRLIQVSAQRDWRFPTVDNVGRLYDERVDVLIGSGPVPPPESSPAGRIRRPGRLAEPDQIRSCRICARLRQDRGGSSRVGPAGGDEPAGDGTRRSTHSRG